MTATSNMLEWQHRAATLADRLATAGAVTDKAWRAAFEEVPRHAFVPRFWALDEYNRPARLVDGADPVQREEWLESVYDDRFLATLWAPLRNGARTVNSSASLPTLVARMLHLLSVEDGHHVLEIGTGTGYNTGLLCHRVGDEHVTSIDIDAVLVAEATDRLFHLGLRPHLVTGDGAEGVPERAQFDRIISTCASPGVPGPWIEQLADGGVIVAPFTLGGALAVLRKTGPEEVTGHLDSYPAFFMSLRPSAGTPIADGILIDVPDVGAVDRNSYHHGTSEMDPQAFGDMDFRLWLSLHLPAGVRIVDLVDDHRGTRTGVVVHDGRHRAEARFPIDGDPVLRVSQDSRRLFDHVDIAWEAWYHRHGSPERHRIGITARTDGSQTTWLDNPLSGVTWPLLPGGDNAWT